MLELLKKVIYIANGRRPWTRGYIATRNKSIQNLFSKSEVSLENLPKNFGQGFDERIIEYFWLFSRLKTGKGRLLDAGSVLNFQYLLDHQKLSEKQIFISTLAPEKYCFWHKSVSYTFEDLRDLSFRADFFDQIVCISTLEHVGMDNETYFNSEIGHVENRSELVETQNKYESYKFVISEFKRVLKPGGKLILTVPYGKYKNLNWLQVFDSNMLDSVIAAFGSSKVFEQIFVCSKDGWVLGDRSMASQADYFNTDQARSGKSNGIAAAQAVACLEITKA
jgi:SAM-dependent methyltransferase